MKVAVGVYINAKTSVLVREDGGVLVLNIVRAQMLAACSCS